MNKKGFTLIELLAVIALLAIIGGIAYASVTGVTANMQKEMLNKKIDMIEEAAILYGQDVKGSIINSTKKYNNNSCVSIIVSDLIPTYMAKDNTNDCLISSSIAGNGCVVNPSNQDEYLDKYEVILYYKNKRIHAKVDIDNNLTCS